MAKFQCSVISYVLARTIDLTVIIPTVTIPETFGMDGKKPSHEIKEKYPVLYLLHGLGNNHSNWCSYSNIELYAEERNIAIVMISGENKFYRTVPGGDDFYRFIEEELPEFITNMFPVRMEPEHTYIAGLSMGGAGALMHGLGNPEKFGAIGAFSPAITMKENEEENEWGMPDLRGLVQQKKSEGGTFPPIYMACGEEDSLYKDDKAFCQYLTENGIQTVWISESGCGHEWRFWDRQIERFLDWLPRRDSYAGRGIRRI